MATAKAKRGMRTLPILEGILPIDPSRISGDVIAGATLAALAIPEVMGYTKIAGTPVITGLYTILLPILFFAILGSSRHLVVGADSATAAILATGLVAMGAGRRFHATTWSSPRWPPSCAPCCSCSPGCSAWASSPTSCPGAS